MADLPFTEPRFSVPSALGLLYGIAAPVSFPGALAQAEGEAPGVSFAGVQVVEDDQALATSAIGTPVLHPVTFRGGDYKSYDREGKVIELTMRDLRLPVSTVMEMWRTKDIVQTQVSAAASTVKEIFSTGDWEVRISGIILDESNHPHGDTTVEKMEERLLEYCDLSDSIQVASDVLQRRGIDRLVIKSINFNALPGRPRMVAFQMQCNADAPLELLIR